MSKKLLSLLFAATVLFAFSACKKDAKKDEPKGTTPTDTTTPDTPQPTTPTHKNFICSEWTSVNLAPLGEVSTVKISFDSSDKTGEYINTPTYVCLDNLVIGSSTIDFESCGVTLNSDGYWDGSDLSYGFTVSGVTFWNQYNTAWGGYSDGGFHLSTLTDKETPGAVNQYSVYGNGGAAGSATFAVVYYSEYTAKNVENYAQMILTNPATLGTVMVTNSTYTYLAIKNGESPATAFTDGDWFKVVFTGYDDTDAEIGSVEFYLADFRAIE